ncbi:MAG: hypothetical protein JWO35_7 [Candidatus Saccharibacteria bacterium]|nr:hypothetical protein [Candidatus Saccharibacteria bacterium]
MSNQIFLCTSKNGKRVTYDPIHSHAATHLEDTPQLKDLVIEAIQNMTLKEDSIGTEIDMGRIVGTSDVVDVDSTDEVVYGIRKNRDKEGHAPFVKSRHGDPCSYVALHLVKQDDGSYVLSSTWIGTFSGDDEPFPNAPDATVRSKEFWNKRAFVYGSQEIQAGTETTKRPW